MTSRPLPFNSHFSHPHGHRAEMYLLKILCLSPRFGMIGTAYGNARWR